MSQPRIFEVSSSLGRDPPRLRTGSNGSPSIREKFIPRPLSRIDRCAEDTEAWSTVVDEIVTGRVATMAKKKKMERMSRIDMWERDNLQTTEHVASGGTWSDLWELESSNASLKA